MTHVNDARRVLTLKINDADIAALEGDTILEAAIANAIPIPTLCHLGGLHDVASCRLCLVEVKGASRLFPACMTPCREGMEVQTETETLRTYRQTLVQLMFAEGNHVCATCTLNGHCELQQLATQLGVDHVEAAYRHLVAQIDASHPRFNFDRNRCVLCTRCLRACDEIEGMHIWDVAGRGIKARLVTDMNLPWSEASQCTSCGKCVLVCPTAALLEKGLTGEEQAHNRQNRPFLASRHAARPRQ